MNKNKKNVKTKQKKQIATTVQQSIPYLECYENGSMQVMPGIFTTTSEYEDISFRTASDEDQESIYEHYQKFLNTILPGEAIQLSFVNFSEDGREKLERIIPLQRGDGFDTYRKETEDMLRDKVLSRNSITTRKFITIRTDADEVDKGLERLHDITVDLENNFKKITKKPIRPLDLSQRLELMNVIMNSSTPNYWFEHDEFGGVKVDFKRMAKQGLTTKDIISPEGLKFDASSIQIGDRVGQVMYLNNLPNWISTNFLSALCNLNFESVISLHIDAMPQEDAAKLVRNKSVNITSELMEKQTKLMNKKMNPEFVSADLKNAKEQIDLLQEDIANRDQKLFHMGLVLIHFAPDMETLNKQKEVITSIASQSMATIKTLMWQQERGLTSVLPMGINTTYVSRLMTTESLGLFMPFDEVTMFDDGGFYYGLNPINKALIIYNRKKGQNYNGLNMGASGSGKSFSAKREMGNVILTTNDDIFIIDPDGEYKILANKFRGTTVSIAPGNGVYLNPLDLDIDNSADPDMNPLAMKIDFVCGLLETMLGANAQLTPAQKTIVDRSLRQIYAPYIEHLETLPPGENGKRITIDRNQCPTLANLYNALLGVSHPEAQMLALAMERYVTGTYDTFAHKTNVDITNRIVVYDIKNIGVQLKELALKICTNDVWMRMIANRRFGKWTWFYVDEFHMLLSNPSTSEFLKEMWKRARKQNGVLTGITQNVEDLLQSPAARAIINNTAFVYMLNQSTIDRMSLQEILKLTDNDVEFITNADQGHGLIYTGKQAIPFADDFPKNTELYKIYSTKSEE